MKKFKEILNKIKSILEMIKKKIFIMKDWIMENWYEKKNSVLGFLSFIFGGFILLTPIIAIGIVSIVKILFSLFFFLVAFVVGEYFIKLGNYILTGEEVELKDIIKKVWNDIKNFKLRRTNKV